MNRKIFQIVFMLVNGIYTLDILSVAEGKTETIDIPVFRLLCKYHL